MRTRSVVTTLLLSALPCAWTGLTACSAAPDDDAVTGQKTTQASTVAIQIEDASGRDAGSCLGTVVAPRLVLTAGHCVVGGSTWTVEAAGGRKVSAQRAVTTWKNFQSNLSHPLHTDVALLVLDEDIKLARYPQISTSGLADGARISRFHRTSASATDATSSDATVKSAATKGFGTAYIVDFAKGEYLDTGGAIVDPKTGRIHGVISGVGGKSGLLYVARTDGVAKWIASAVSECGSSGDGVGVRTYPSSSSGSSSGGWGGSSSGGWGGSSGSWGGYGGDGNKIDAGPAPSADAGAQADSGAGSGSGSNTGSATNGTNGSNGGGSSGSGPNENGEVGAGAGSGATCPAKPPSQGAIEGGQSPSGSNTSDSNGATPGSSGTTGGAGGSSTTGGDSTTGGGGTGTGAGTGGGTGGGGGTASGTTGTDQEVCEGSADNPDICPPDGANCTGPGCGGCKGVSGCVDGVMDYGNCACGGSSTLGNPDGLR